MIHDERIDLNVPFAQKEEAKALGARWDQALRTWFIPPGTDLTGFNARWLPSEIARARDGAGEESSERGIPLSELLAKVKGVVAKGLPDSVWVRAEISEVASNKSGNIYLQLVDRSEHGDALGKIKGIIWKSRAPAINAKFAEATGEGLRTDIKILCLAQVRFDPLFGLDLTIEDVDPAYTLGDLAAKLARIRKRLLEEGLAARNQRLPAPLEFLRIAVISPETSAGLGDFRREADRLHYAGLCQFAYFGATFQGVDAPSSIRAALSEVQARHRERAFDAVAIIRGGGSATDLAWLNDLELARMICLATVPVLTGIGHERDSTVLDEVAHRRFDTPSKVVLHITSTIRDNAFAAITSMDVIRLQVARAVNRERTALGTQWDRMQTGVENTVQRAEEGRRRSLALIRASALARVRQEHASVDTFSDRIRSGGAVSMQRAAEAGEKVVDSILTAARFHLREANQSLQTERQRLTGMSTQVASEAESRLSSLMGGVVHRSELLVQERAAEVEKQFSTIGLKARAVIDAVGCSADTAAEAVRRTSFTLIEKAMEKISGFFRLMRCPRILVQVL